MDYKKLLTCLGAILLSIYVYSQYVTVVIIDDSYMFVRYAHNILEHGVYGWLADEPSYGCTSILFVFSHVFFMSLGLHEYFGVHFYIYLHNLIYFILAIYLIFNLSRSILKQANIYGLPVLIITMLSGIPLAVHLTGMDTIAAVCTNILMVQACLQYTNSDEKKKTSIYYLIFIGYLGFLTRPDNFFYVTLFPFLWMLYHRVKWTKIIQFSLGITAVLLFHFLGVYLYFGDPLPIPYYVKTADFYSVFLGIYYWNSGDYVMDMLLINTHLIVLSILGLFTPKLKKILIFYIPFVITTGILITKVQIMGTNGRYYYPSLSFLLAPALLALKEILLLKSRKAFFSNIDIYLAVGLFCVFMAQSDVVLDAIFKKKEKKAYELSCDYEILFKPHFYKETHPIIGVLRFRYDVDQLIKYIDDEKFTVAASEHGRIAAFNLNSPIICFVGLHNTGVLKEKSFNSKVIGSSLEKYKPDLVWMPHYDYAALRYNILQNEQLFTSYNYYEYLADFGVAIRKDSPFRQKIETFLKETHHIDTLIPTEYYLTSEL